MKLRGFGYFCMLILGLGILVVSLVLAGFDKLKSDIRTNSLRNFPIQYVKEIGDGQKISKTYNTPESNILPGDWRYFLKKFRDEVWVVLSKTPREKAEVYLLMADKRMYETMQLIKNQSNNDLIVKTLDDSVYNLKKAKESLFEDNKKDIEFFKTDLKINQAGLAYEDILKSINYRNEEINKTINELEKWNQKNKEDMGKN